VADFPVMAEEERNLKVVKAYWEAFNQGDVPAALALFSDPVLNNGREVPRAFIGKIFDDMPVRTPDISFEIEEIVAIKQNVIVRGEYSGTHLGIAPPSSRRRIVGRRSAYRQKVRCAAYPLVQTEGRTDWRTLRNSRRSRHDGAARDN
jgi:predicted ester cyclase